LYKLRYPHLRPWDKWIDDRPSMDPERGHQSLFPIPHRQGDDAKPNTAASSGSEKKRITKKNPTSNLKTLVPDEDLNFNWVCDKQFGGSVGPGLSAAVQRHPALRLYICGSPGFMEWCDLLLLLPGTKVRMVARPVRLCFSDRSRSPRGSIEL
jgi:hypothetical protein